MQKFWREMKEISGIDKELWSGSGKFWEIRQIMERYEGWILGRLERLGKDEE